MNENDNNLINDEEDEEEKEVEPNQNPSQLEDISTRRLDDARIRDNALLFKFQVKMK